MTRFREPNLDPPDEPDLSPLREKVWNGATVIGADFASEITGDFTIEYWVRPTTKPVTFFEVNSEGGRLGRIRWRNQGILGSRGFGKTWWSDGWPSSFYERMVQNRVSPIRLSDLKEGEWTNVTITRNCSATHYYVNDRYWGTQEQALETDMS